MAQKSRHLSLKATSENNGQDIDVRILDDGLVLEASLNRIFLANEHWRFLVLAYLKRATLSAP